ncbi:hypothetical protein O181_069932 [Austropuccinia psidii MF-1]|uniref:Uncharacterized protein n=1 Tax=Austropuccinia psidii MF-1 TaxID=1389203 RepID=A0A9Q3I7S0_9BASI|nr:hypothetical protein [Austropuccinia psidii MF-1]
MGFKRQKKNPPNPLQQETPIPCMPHKKTMPKWTTGPSGTQWLEDLFWGPSQSSKSQVPSHEDPLMHEPEPEVPPMKFMEETFARPTTPHSVIIINNTPVSSPLNLPLPLLPWRFQLPPPLAPSSPHSHNEAQQEFTDLQPTQMIP